ncbi:MAG: trehalose-phosphatase [Candidatus Omnitrophota bacterium]
MKYFFDEWKKFEKELLNKQLFLFLDYDGTLAPIAETPETAVMPQAVRKSLITLSKSPGCHLTAVSGRMLADLKQKIDIPGITYVGTHGLEMDDPEMDTRQLVSGDYMEDLSDIKALLTEQLAALKGILVEDKKMVLTVHYRLSDYTEAVLAKKIFMDVCRSYLNSQRINVLEGKKVIEVRPPVQWNKGDAVLWLSAKWQKKVNKEKMLIMYAGDDVTDEDAFRAIGNLGLTVKIGDPEGSAAQYYLKAQNEMGSFLKQISETLSKGKEKTA